MAQKYDVKGMAARIAALRQDAEALGEISGGIPAVECNITRLLASIKMLEIDISHAAEILGE